MESEMAVAVRDDLSDAVFNKNVNSKINNEKHNLRAGIMLKKFNIAMPVYVSIESLHLEH